MLNVKKDRNIISGLALLRAKYTPIAGEMNITVINVKKLRKFFIDYLSLCSIGLHNFSNCQNLNFGLSFKNT
jgi:hypothetical protein